MASRYVSPVETALDLSGVPISGAEATFYESGTVNFANTYSDDDLTIANTNPVVADSAGRFPNIFLQAIDYKVVLKNADGAIIWTRDPVRHHVSGEEVTSAGSTTGRTLADRFADVINVKDYGAVGDGVTDDTSAINAAFDELRTRVNATYNYIYASVYFPPGQYVVSSVNATGIRRFGWGIIGLGAALIGNTAGKAVLDMVHSRFGHVSDIIIVGDGTTSPKFGIQIGRIDNSSVADAHLFTNVQCRGTFTKACLYNHASEGALHNFCRFFNSHDDTGTSYCIILDSHSDYSLSSDYQTITATSNTPKSFTGLVFNQADCRKETSGRTIMLNGQSFGVEMNKCYGVSFDDVVMEISSKDSQHRQIYIDLHCETSSGTPGTTTCLAWTTRNSGTAVPITRDFRFSDHSPHASAETFLADTGITTVTLQNVDIRIPSFETTPSNGVFNPKANFKVYGGFIYVQDGATLSNIGEMNVTISTDDRSNTTYSVGSQMIFDQTNRTVSVKGRIEAGGADKDVAVAGFAGDSCWLEKGALFLHDGITAPNQEGKAVMYVDSADGDLKIKFADGFIVTIAADS